MGRITKRILKDAVEKVRGTSFNTDLWNVKFQVRDIDGTIDREAIYMPNDGSVAFEQLNDYFIDQIAKRRDIPSELVEIIGSAVINGYY